MGLVGSVGRVVAAVSCKGGQGGGLVSVLLPFLVWGQGSQRLGVMLRKWEEPACVVGNAASARNMKGLAYSSCVRCFQKCLQAKS